MEKIIVDLAKVEGTSKAQKVLKRRKCAYDVHLTTSSEYSEQKYECSKKKRVRIIVQRVPKVPFI